MAAVCSLHHSLVGVRSSMGTRTMHPHQHVHSPLHHLAAACSTQQPCTGAEEPSDKPVQ